MDEQHEVVVGSKVDSSGWRRGAPRHPRNVDGALPLADLGYGGTKATAAQSGDHERSKPRRRTAAGGVHARAREDAGSTHGAAESAASGRGRLPPPGTKLVEGGIRHPSCALANPWNIQSTSSVAHPARLVSEQSRSSARLRGRALPGSPGWVRAVVVLLCLVGLLGGTLRQWTSPCFSLADVAEASGGKSAAAQRVGDLVSSAELVEDSEDSDGEEHFLRARSLAPTRATARVATHASRGPERTRAEACHNPFLARGPPAA